MRNYQEYTLLDAASSTGAGKVVDVRDFRHCILSLSTDNSANGTIQVQGSIQDNYDQALDFDSAQSPTNMWDYIEVVDLESGSTIDGGTGVTLSGSDDNRLFQVNTDALRFLTVNITTHNAGDWTVKALVFTE